MGYYRKARNISKFIDKENYDNEVVRENIHKYHLVNCQTLQTAKLQGWRGKYNISRKIDSTFFYRYVKNNSTFKELDNQKLNVCKYCLNIINNELDDSKRYSVIDFIPDVFFNSTLFEKGRLIRNPTDQFSDAAPANIYPEDWKAISKKYKEKAQYQCEGISCIHSDLSKSEYRQYLDCHHVDHDKSNSEVSNLKALCVLCHAKEPNHSHMINSPRYNQYKELLRKDGIL